MVKKKLYKYGIFGKLGYSILISHSHIYRLNKGTIYQLDIEFSQ